MRSESDRLRTLKGSKVSGDVSSSGRGVARTAKAEETTKVRVERRMTRAGWRERAGKILERAG